MAANFTVGVTFTHPLTQSPVLGSYTVCGEYHPGVETSGPMVSVKCTQPLRSRYVIVQFHTTDHLSLCEVEVYTAEGRLVIVFSILSRSLSLIVM